jgi:hypothetical protein
MLKMSIFWSLCGLVIKVPGYRSKDPGIDSRHYQILWEVVGIKRGPLSLVNITEKLLEWKSSGFGSRKPRLMTVDPLCWPRGTFSQEKLALTSPTCGGRSFGIVRLRTKAKEFSLGLNNIQLRIFLNTRGAVWHWNLKETLWQLVGQGT